MGPAIGPAVGAASPPMARNRLVLPAPLRPTRPTFSLARTVKLAASTTRRPPTSTLSPVTCNTRPEWHIDPGYRGRNGDGRLSPATGDGRGGRRRIRCAGVGH